MKLDSQMLRGYAKYQKSEYFGALKDLTNIVNEVRKQMNE